MAGYDFSQVSDADLESVMDDLLNDPVASAMTPLAQRQATVAEYNRRRRKPATKPATNVDRDLEAAASPITPDPAVGPKPAPGPSQDFSRRLPGESMAAYGERYARHLEAQRHASNAAIDARRAAGYKDDAQREIEAEYATQPIDGPNAGNATMRTPDGLEVPVAYDDGIGNQYYTLGSERRAREAEQDARWRAGHRQMVDDDIAKYGPYTVRDTAEIGDGPGQLTQEQYDNRQARKRAEEAAQDTPRARELRRQRLHARAGIPEQATEDMSEEARLRMLGRNQQSAQSRSARAAVTRRAQAQQNPLEYLGREDVNDWQQMVMADRLLRAGAGQMTPLGVEAVGGQNALNMLRGMNLGQGMDNPLVRAQAAAAEVQTDQARREMRQEDEDVLGEKYAPGDTNVLPWWLGGGYNEFTVAEQQQMYDDLIARGYTPAEAQAAVDRQANKRRATDRATWNK